MAKRNLQSVADDLAALAATLPTQRVAAPAPPPAEREKAFTLNMRLSLHRQLDRLAADADMTMKAFILAALQAKGLDVAPADLIDRRGARAKKT